MPISTVLPTPLVAIQARYQNLNRNEYRVDDGMKKPVYVQVRRLCKVVGFRIARVCGRIGFVGITLDVDPLIVMRTLKPVQ